jgi:hypothetical protein
MSGVPSHGTVIAMAEQETPTVWEDIAELGDLQLPGLFRNETDTSSHNDDIDKYNLGILRRNPVTFPLFFNKALTSHMKLQDAIIHNKVNGFKITQPDGMVWIASGGVSAMNGTAPVDGVQTAEVTLRFSGRMLLNGQVIGGL